MQRAYLVLQSWSTVDYVRPACVLAQYTTGVMNLQVKSIEYLRQNFFLVRGSFPLRVRMGQSSLTVFCLDGVTGASVSRYLSLYSDNRSIFTWFVSF
jgi:hypothetical protein